MRIIFAGTPAFAARALDALVVDGNEILLVLTQPDRPAGRGMLPKPPPVKETALLHHLEVFQPNTLKDEAVQTRLHDLHADIMVVAAYGLILPQAVLDIPRFGCLNIHASLLPRWRGAAPIQRAILAGDKETGICIMQMEAGLDTGPVLLRQSVHIDDEDDTASLHDKLADIGSRLIVETISRLRHHPQQPLPAEPQAESGITYANKISRSDYEIDWKRPAEEIERHIRAFSPSPGAYTGLNGTIVKLWRACVVNQPTIDQSVKPGHVLAAGKDGILIACGQNALLVNELQKAGGKRLGAGPFLAGTPLTNMCFSSSST